MKAFITILLCLLLNAPAFSLTENEAYVLQLVRSQKYDEARALLETFEPTPADRQFLEAEIAYEQDRYRAAISAYQDLIDQNPEIIILRERLIQIQLEDNASISARNELAELAKLNLDPISQVSYRQIMDVLDKVDYRSVTYNFQLSPSQNINNASDTSAIALAELPEELRPQFGWKASIGAMGIYVRKIADRQSLDLRLYAGADFYTVETLDQRYVQLNAGWNYRDARHDLRLEAYRGRVWGDGESYGIRYRFEDDVVADAVKLPAFEDANYWGVFADYRYQFTDQHAISLYTSWSQKKYDMQEEVGYADNQRRAVKLGYSFAPKSGAVISPFIQYTLYQEKGPEADYRSQNGYVGWEIGVNTKLKLEKGWQVSLLASREIRDYELPHNFVFGAYARDEVTNQAVIEVSNLNWRLGPLLPSLQCAASQNKANIVDFERQSLGCGFMLRKVF